MAILKIIQDDMKIPKSLHHDTRIKQNVVEPNFKYGQLTEDQLKCDNIKARLKLKLLNINLASINSGDIR